VIDLAISSTTPSGEIFGVSGKVPRNDSRPGDGGGEGYDQKYSLHNLNTIDTIEEIDMPEFATPFAGLASDRKLTKQELIRAIRYSIAAEYEAIQLYMQLSESTDDARAAEVLKDVADEERVHAGEFLRLLRELAPDEQRFYAEGAEEAEEMLKRKSAETDKQGFDEKGTETHVGMPYCTLAAAAEHSRGYIEEEPCDDAGPGRHETNLYK
jgi:hypothetical protein